MCLAILVYAIDGMIDGLRVTARARVLPSVLVKPSVIASEMVFCSRIGYTAVAGSLLGVWLVVSGYRKKSSSEKVVAICLIQNRCVGSFDAVTVRSLTVSSILLGIGHQAARLSCQS